MDGLEFNIDRHGGSEKVFKNGVPAEMITPGFCIQRSLLSHAQDEVLFRDPSFFFSSPCSPASPGQAAAQIRLPLRTFPR